MINSEKEDIVWSQLASDGRTNGKYHTSTRQNVNDLVNRGKLVPIDAAGKNYQFYRKDVEALL